MQTTHRLLKEKQRKEKQNSILKNANFNNCVMVCTYKHVVFSCLFQFCQGQSSVFYFCEIFQCMLFSVYFHIQGVSCRRIACMIADALMLNVYTIHKLNGHWWSLWMCDYTGWSLVSWICDLIGWRN